MGRTSWFAIVLMGALLSGCGATSTAAPEPAPKPAASAGVPVQVETDPPSIPTDDASSGPKLDLPQLPVGGATAEVGDDLQCGEISWTAFDGDASLDHGVRVVVAGYRLDTAHFTPAAADGCGTSSPNCLDFTFEPGRTQCTVAVRTVRPWSPGTPVLQLVVAGRADCSAVDRTSCQTFLDGVRSNAQGTITLQPPPESGSGSGSGSESSPTPIPTPISTPTA